MRSNLRRMARRVHLLALWSFATLLGIWGLATLAYIGAVLHGRTSLWSFLAHNLMSFEQTATMGQAEATRYVLTKVGVMIAVTGAAGLIAKATKKEATETEGQSP